MKTLDELQTWYSQQCNGEWEHRYGVSIETLDNPGWLVKIDLTGTPLATKSFQPREKLNSDAEWFSCKVTGSRFEGAGGPCMLGHLLSIFLEWAQS